MAHFFLKTAFEKTQDFIRFNPKMPAKIGVFQKIVFFANPAEGGVYWPGAAPGGGV